MLAVSLSACKSEKELKESSEYDALQHILNVDCSSSSGLEAYFSMALAGQMKRLQDRVEIDAQTIDTLFVGDSMMWFCKRCSSGHDSNGVITIPEVNGAFSNSLNLAIPESKTKQTYEHVLSYLGYLKSKNITPKNLVISSTGNDILKECDLIQADTNRKRIVDLAYSFGVQRIIWMPVPHIMNDKYSKVIDAQDEKIAELVKKGVVVPTAMLLELNIGKYADPTKNNGDGIHHNDAGYEIWIKYIQPALIP